MMQSAARQPLGGWRNEDLSLQIAVSGLDLTGKALRMQVRLAPDTPGSALLSLAAVGMAGTLGIRLVSVTVANGVPTSTIAVQVPKSSMQSLPYSGEIGESTILSYALQLDGVTRMFGPFAAFASAIDSDAAPANRSPGYGSAPSPGAPGGALLLTVSTDGALAMTIGGADLLAPFAAAAKASADAAAARLAQFPGYYAGANGGLTPTINFGAIQNQALPATVTTFLVENGRHVIVDAAATDADVANVPHCITKSKAPNAVYIARDLHNMRIDDVVACADNGTDLYPVIQEALEYYRVVARRHARTAYYQGGTLDFLVGTYLASQTIELHQSIRLRGQNRGRENAPVTVIQVAASKTGLIVGRDNSVGVMASDGGGHGSAEGTVIEGIAFVSQGGASQSQFDASGIVKRATSQLINCDAIGFPAYGIADLANDGTPYLGNDNESLIWYCGASHNGIDGLIMVGNNANCGTVYGLFSGYNGGYGVRFDTPVSGAFTGGHLVANGQKGQGLAQAATSIVRFGNSIYCVVPGQVAAAQNAQPGTNLIANPDGLIWRPGDSASWYLVENIPANRQADDISANIPYWQANMPLCEGGSAHMGSAGWTWASPYTEGRQGPLHFNRGDPALAHPVGQGGHGAGYRQKQL